MKLCTTCSRLYEARHSFCGQDGTRLSWVHVGGPLPTPPAIADPDADIRDTQPMFPVKRLPDPAASARR